MQVGQVFLSRVAVCTGIVSGLVAARIVLLLLPLRETCSF